MRLEGLVPRGRVHQPEHPNTWPFCEFLLGVHQSSCASSWLVTLSNIAAKQNRQSGAPILPGVLFWLRLLLGWGQALGLWSTFELSSQDGFHQMNSWLDWLIPRLVDWFLHLTVIIPYNSSTVVDHWFLSPRVNYSRWLVITMVNYGYYPLWLHHAIISWRSATLGLPLAFRQAALELLSRSLRAKPRPCLFGRLFGGVQHGTTIIVCSNNDNNSNNDDNIWQ